MSLANIEGKLSRAEMKKIMAGSDGCNAQPCAGGGSGTCKTTINGCKCSISEGDSQCV